MTKMGVERRAIQRQICIKNERWIAEQIAENSFHILERPDKKMLANRLSSYIFLNQSNFNLISSYSSDSFFISTFSSILCSILLSSLRPHLYQPNSCLLVLVYLPNPNYKWQWINSLAISCLPWGSETVLGHEWERYLSSSILFLILCFCLLLSRYGISSLHVHTLLCNSIFENWIVLLSSVARDLSPRSAQSPPQTNKQ